MSVVLDEISHDGERTFTAAENGGDKKFGYLSSSSSSSSFSSIGRNSDDEDGEIEVESSYKSPLDMMESLEEVLPIRRGISKFYKGKSKSFMNLSEAASSSMKDLGKPENPFSRRRRILFSHRICSRGGIAKKPVKSGFTLAVTTAMRESERDSSSFSGDVSPPRHHHKNLPPRQSKGSFGNCVSVVDSARCLQTAADREIPNVIC